MGQHVHIRATAATKALKAPVAMLLGAGLCVMVLLVSKLWHGQVVSYRITYGARKKGEWKKSGLPKY